MKPQTTVMKQAASLTVLTNYQIIQMSSLLNPAYFAKIHLNPLFCKQYHQPYFNQINALWEQKKIHT